MRPVPRYVLAVMAGVVVSTIWQPILILLLRGSGSHVPLVVQALVLLAALTPPIVVSLGVSDYFADRPGLVKPYQPQRRDAAAGPGASRPPSEVATAADGPPDPLVREDPGPRQD